MTVHYINSSFTITMPDVDFLKTNKIRLEKFYSTVGILHLPIIQEQLNNLKTQQREIDNRLRELLVTIPVDLHLESLGMLIAKAATNRGATSIYAAEIIDIITDSVESISEKVTDLSDNLITLKTLALSDVTGYIEADEKQVEKQQTACTAVEQAVVDISAEKEVLNAAMRVMEDKTIWDEWTPMFKAIARLDPKSPQLSLMTAALAGVTNILRIASESVTYTDLVEARKRLQDRLDGHASTIKKYNDEKTTLTRQIKQLGEFQAVDPHKKNYENEVEKVSITLESFVNIHSRTDQDNALEQARAFIGQGETLSSYLQEILQKLK